MNTNLEFLKKTPGDLLALVAGGIMPLAFAPFSIYLLAPISLVLLMFCWHQISPGRAFFRGWLYGISMFGFGVSWVHISMNEYGGIGIPLAVFLTALFVMFLALFPALTGYLGRRLVLGGEHKLAREYLLIVPAMWMLVEWIRGIIFTGFPWLSIGYSQIDTALSGYAPIFGVYFVSYVTVMTAGLIAYWILQGKTALKIALPSLIAVWIVGAALKAVPWSQPVDDPIKISMIQGNVSQDKKWLPEQRLPTLNMYTELSRKNWDSDLIIWPETAVPSLYHQAIAFLKNIAQEARMNSSELLVGIPVYNKREDEYFNAMLSLGLKESFYEKTHLVPFGEFIPFKDYIGDLLEILKIPMANFTAGRQEKPLLFVGGQNAGISICYEDVFGEEVALALPEATYLINTSNDAWFGDSLAPHQHLEIARMRSLETGRYLVRSTNTGISAFIDDKGKIISTSPQFETHVLTESIQPMQGMTFYAVFTNIPVVLLSIILLGTAVILGRKSKADISKAKL